LQLLLVIRATTAAVSFHRPFDGTLESALGKDKQRADGCPGDVIERGIFKAIQPGGPAMCRTQLQMQAVARGYDP
jgi:hypothetical protein